MNYFTAFLLVASALAESSLPTYTSTILSSTACASCQVVPSSFAYANSSTQAVAAGAGTSSSAGQSTVLEYDTAYDDSVSTYITTVCNSAGQCYVTTQTSAQTVTTEYVDGVLTVVTTQVPVDSSSTVASPVATTASSKAAVTAAPSPESTTTRANTVVVTVTSCSDNKCSTKEETQVLTTKTETVDGVKTVYTTYCPLSTSTPETSAPKTSAPHTAAPEHTSSVVHTTVITVTSCSDNKCSEVPKTTGVTVVTENDTVYTTYCPLTTTTPTSAPVAPSTTKVSTTKTPEPAKSTDVHTTTVITITSCKDDKCAPTPVTTGVTVITKDSTVYTTFCPLPSSSEKPKQSTINVITNNIVTQTPKTTVVQQTSTPPAVSTLVPAVSTYAGAGAIVKSSVLGVVLSVLLMAL